MSNIIKKYLDLDKLSEFKTAVSNLIDSKISAIETFTGASSQEDGASGLVPAPEQGDQEKFLRGDGSWAIVSGAVTGVKGSSESSYRSGNVNIAKDNVGIFEGTTLEWTSKTTAQKALYQIVILSDDDD